MFSVITRYTFLFLDLSELFKSLLQIHINNRVANNCKKIICIDSFGIYSQDTWNRFLFCSLWSRNPFYSTYVCSLVIPTDYLNMKAKLYYFESDKTVTTKPLRSVVTLKSSLTVEEQLPWKSCFSTRSLQIVLCWSHVLQTDGSTAHQSS